MGYAHEFFLRIPGEVGRNLVQRYFEAEHSATAVLHPRTELAPSTPAKRDRRSNPQSASNSSRRIPRGLPPRPTAPAQNLQSTYGSIQGQAAPPTYPPYYGYAPSNNRFRPAQFPYGTFTNGSGGSTTYPMYGHDSYSFRY